MGGCPEPLSLISESTPLLIVLDDLQGRIAVAASY